MKCLSLWQPWATLIAIGAKQIETRSWTPPGPRPMTLAIHAAKTWNNVLNNLLREEPFKGALRNEPAVLPKGCVVAVATLVRCDRTDRLIGSLTAKERAFGDYSPGRWGWVLADVRRLPKPVPCVGRQGLFDVPDEVIAQALGERERLGPRLIAGMERCRDRLKSEREGGAA